jgi:Transcription factor WhiB
VLDRPDHIAASPADRARAALLDDHTLTNAEVALRARAAPAQVASVRRALASYGVIPPASPPRRSFPAHVPLPRSPRVLAEGACVGVVPSPWTSDDPADRTRARLTCITGCHVAAACLSWALRAVPASDSAIYAGTGPSERRQLRAAAGLQRPNAVTAINAAKTCCPECGLPLSGENLITEPGRRPGSVRRRCRACTRARKAAAYAAGRRARGEARPA